MLNTPFFTAIPNINGVCGKLNSDPKADTFVGFVGRKLSNNNSTHIIYSKSRSVT